MHKLNWQSHKYTNNLYIFFEFLKGITFFDPLDVSLNLLKNKPGITGQFSSEYTEAAKRKPRGQNLQGLQRSPDSGCMKKHLSCCLVTCNRTFHNRTFSGNQNEEKTRTAQLLTSQKQRGGEYPLTSS